jgi:hypothetical protein
VRDDDHHSHDPSSSRPKITSHTEEFVAASRGFNGGMLIVLADSIRAEIGENPHDTIAVANKARRVDGVRTSQRCPYDEGRDLVSRRSTQIGLIRLANEDVEVELRLLRRLRRGRVRVWIHGWDERTVGGVAAVVRNRAVLVREETKLSAYDWLKTSNWSLAIFGSGIGGLLTALVLALL